MTYCDEDDFAIKRNYASFIAYSAANNNFPTSTKIADDIADNEDIINSVLGNWNESTSDTRFTGYIKRLSVNMLLRRYGMDMAEDSDPTLRFNPHDFLFERERLKLRDIGAALGTRKLGGVV